MSDYRPYIRLPTHLFSGHPLVLVSEPHDDDEFAAHQVEFVRHLFGRCAYLREQSRPTPVSDTFLSVFVNLIDILEANSPGEARHCATHLYQVLRVVFPDIEPPAALHMNLARSPDSAPENGTPKPNGKLGDLNSVAARDDKPAPSNGS